jgi:hypothetical protein
VPPSPPQPPGLPPSPPAPPQSPSPRPPPPVIPFFERLRDEERDSDADCELVEYAECAEILRQFAANNRGYSSNLRVTTQHCEETQTEPDCFLGCAYGDRTGGTYRFLLPEVDDRFTKPRCKLSIHPRCACRNKATSAPFMLVPPPPPRTYTEEWNIVQIPFLQSDGTARDTSRGAVGAMTQRLVNGRTLDLSLRAGPMHTFQVRRTCHQRPKHTPLPTRLDPFFAVSARGRRPRDVRAHVRLGAPEPAPSLHRDGREFEEFATATGASKPAPDTASALCRRRKRPLQRLPGLVLRRRGRRALLPRRRPWLLHAGALPVWNNVFQVRPTNGSSIHHHRL